MEEILNYFKNVCSTCQSFCENSENKSYLQIWKVRNNPYQLYMSLTTDEKTELNIDYEKFMEACFIIEKINTYIDNDHVFADFARTMNCRIGSVHEMWNDKCKKNTVAFIYSSFYPAVLKWISYAINLDDIKELIKNGKQPCFEHFQCSSNVSCSPPPLRNYINPSKSQVGLSIKKTNGSGNGSGNGSHVSNSFFDISNKIRSLEDLEKIFQK